MSKPGKQTGPLLLILFSLLVILMDIITFAGSISYLKRCTESTYGYAGKVTSRGEEFNGSRYSLSRIPRYTTTVKYQAGDDTYSVKTKPTFRHLREKEKIEVRYDPAEPSFSYTPEYNGHPLLRLFVGLGILVIGIIWSIRNIRRNSQNTAG